MLNNTNDSSPWESKYVVYSLFPQVFVKFCLVNVIHGNHKVLDERILVQEVLYLYLLLPVPGDCNPWGILYFLGLEFPQPYRTINLNPTVPWGWTSVYTSPGENIVIIFFYPCLSQLRLPKQNTIDK